MKKKKQVVFQRECKKHWIYYPITETGCSECLKGGENK